MKNLTMLYSVIILFTSCQSASKLLQEGRYEKAAYSAAGHLKSNPSDEALQQILVESYNLTIHQYDSLINDADQSKSNDRFETQYASYRAVQELTATIRKLPANATQKIKTVDYSREMSMVASRAAEERYNLGIKLLDQKNKADAYEAWENFKKAEEYDPNYRDVAQMTERAYEAALTLVEVSVSQERFPLYDINAAWLKQGLIWNLETLRTNHTLLKFTLSDDLTNQSLRPDQKLQLDFTDMRFDMPIMSDYSYERTREVTVTDNEGNQRVIMVQATVYVTRRILTASAVLMAELRSLTDGRTLLWERFPADYTWRSISGRYTGDQRALSADDLSIINNMTPVIPGRDELFRMLSEKCINDMVFRLQTIYK
ncbi:MAG: hypothetical protein CVU06_06595 [Bacteroidetes bacterium HGW-Bacteroidetes-22]|nr:MAG: hypothetical protein CVU06_06595 [Bacteroidetes bacterium HGW-Bacteroidetes-22]